MTTGDGFDSRPRLDRNGAVDGELKTGGLFHPAPAQNLLRGMGARALAMALEQEQAAGQNGDISRGLFEFLTVAKGAA